ncbi:MAG: Hpt domain-containing protein [Bacteroidales bacterium]
MEYKYIKTDYLEMVAGGDLNLVKELVDMFRDQVAEIHAEMRKLLKEGDYHALGLLAHKAKSSVAIMGMEELANMLKRFELRARDGDHSEQYKEYVEKFGKDTAAAITELDSFVANK